MLGWQRFSQYRSMTIDPPPSRGRLRLLNLLWIVPVAIFVDLDCLLVAKIAECGISGCSGAGFGVRRDPGTVVAAIIGSGLVTGALLAFVPWYRRRPVRIVVAVLGAAASWAFVALQYAT